MIIDELIALLGYDIQGEEDLKRFNKGLDSVEKKAYAVGAAIGKMAMAAGAAVATGFSVLGYSVLGTAAKFETYAATLETIEGSTQGAATALQWVKDFAKTTPYEVDELTASFVKLRSYGLDPMDGTMTVLGDTAAGMGKSINQVVEALADATTFQFERLRELGIVASQAGDQVTFSWTENGKSMTKTIKKTSAEVTKFLNETWGKKFGGAMIRQSKTWTGMLSNLGDSWTDFQLRIADAGFFDTVKNKLGDLMDLVARWDKDGTLDNIASTLSSAFTAVANGIGYFAERIGNHIAWINKNFETLKPWLTAIGAGLGTLVAMAFPLMTAFFVLGFAIDDFLTYLQGGESIIGNFIKWIQDMTGASEGLAKALAGIVASLTLLALLRPGATLKGIGKLAGLGGGGAAAAAGGGLMGVLGKAGVYGLALMAMLGTASAVQKRGNELEMRPFEQNSPAGWLDSLTGGRLSGKKPEQKSETTPATGEGNAFIKMIAAMENMQDNMAKMATAEQVPPNDMRDQSVNVTAPVTVHVKEAAEAPAAVGNAIAGQINSVARDAQPARMQGGNAF